MYKYTLLDGNLVKTEIESDKTLTEKDKLSIQQEADALFEEKKAMLTENSEPVSEEVIKFLEKYPELKEVIQPFTIKRRGSGSFTNYKQLRETQSSAFL